MAIVLEKISNNSGAYPSGLAFESEAQLDGSERPVVKLGSVTSANVHTGLEELRVFSAGHICVQNSTNVPLAGNATFTGEWQDTLDYSEVIVSVVANVASATDGLVIEWSSAGVTKEEDDVFTVPAANGKTWSFPCNRRFVRVVYTNGATAQTTFNMQTLLKRFASKGSSHRLADSLNAQDDAIVTKTLVAGKTTAGGGAIVDVKVNPSGALTVDASISGITATVPTTSVDDFYHDAFQRQRVSNTNQRFDAEFLYSKQPLQFDEILGGVGTSTWSANSRDITLAINGTALADAAGMYQHFYNPYTPGNSQFVAITGVLNGTNLSGTAALFLRSNVTGSVVETVYDQSTWLAATSGVNWNYSQIFLMDFQSLKVGRIRFALDRAGIAVPVKVIENDNARASGYWQLANAPTFWRIYNTATATVTEFGYGDASNAIGFRFTSALNATQTARAICTTVKSEGGGDLMDMPGFPFAASNGATTRTVAATMLPVLSIQIKTTFGTVPNRGLVVPISTSVLTDNPIYWEWRLNPTLTGASFTSVDANSITNFDVAATVVTGGRIIASGYSSAGGNKLASTDHGLTDKVPLSVNYAGTVGDILSFCAVRVGSSSASMGVALDWKEIR